MGTGWVEALSDLAIYGSAVGQVLFVLGWVRQAWWTHWVTRAVMFKASMLAVVLVYRAWMGHSGHSTPPPDYGTEQYVGLALMLLLTVGVWFQTVTLWYHVHIAKVQPRITNGNARFSSSDTYR